MKKLLYGVAYYDEYMPYDRLLTDIAMMKKAGINTVRIAESTWSTCEPQDGVFDFSHVERVLNAMEENGISVIVGTPTYAIPTWMVKSHPEVLAVTIKGRGIYGARQIMDITHPAYRFYAERVIRELMKRTAHRQCVIGFQVDNETKYYGTSGKNVQENFVKYLRRKFNDELNAMNHAFGLDYWSNRINAWEDFPDVRGTINGSLGAEFEKFQRLQVSEFLSWQADIVNEYKRKDQFITHNFDFEWRGYSYGVQPDVNHYEAAKCLTIASVDIYHPSQDALTGEEIAFGGDMARSLKKNNYFVMETQAQGFPCWTPYQGQLLLQAFSHVASGANAVMYWHWHSIHNSFETYWKGVLSHDFQENDAYREVCKIGKIFHEKGERLVNLKKTNEVAILVSNEALTALKWFGIEATASDKGKMQYNDVIRWVYNTLYKMNVECDVIWIESEQWENYKMIVVPVLYSVSDDVLSRLNHYVENGGVLVATFKTGFANENLKVSCDVQPRILNDCLGISYNQFTFPTNVALSGTIIGGDEYKVQTFMELLTPKTAEVLAKYEHYNWNKYAAITRNTYKAGISYYIGCMTDERLLTKVFSHALSDADVIYPNQAVFPLIIKSGINDLGNRIRFYFNYSDKELIDVNVYSEGVDLITDVTIKQPKKINIPAWGVKIIEEKS